MFNRFHLVVIPAVAAVLLGRAAAAEPDVTFERDVRPILRTHCFQCHGEGEKLKGKLDLRLRHLIVTGGRGGPALEPGKPEESLLVRRMADQEMPPPEVTKRPTPQEVERIRRWIAAGAPTARTEPKAIGAEPYFTEEERTWWAFLPVKRPAVPTVKDAAKVRTPIDAFLLAALEKKRLTFAPEADKATLIRRLTFDLLGVPPTPAEVERFVADTAPDAYERLVDILLASPQYGERWGRHWLDIAGYADSEGHTDRDPLRLDAWRYRDYVIRSLNADKPLDQFIQEQLAGDEMVRPPYRDLSADDLDKLAATGFLRMVPDGTGQENTPTVRNQVLADTLQVVSTSLLGMTVQCARCHDHRYDPISHVDYHRLRAVFEPALDWQNWRTPDQRRISLTTEEVRKKIEAVEREAAEVKRTRDELARTQIAKVNAILVGRVPESDREIVAAAMKLPRSKRTAEQEKVLDRYPTLKVGVNPSNLELFQRLPGIMEGQKKLEALDAQIKTILAGKPQEEYVRVLTEVPSKVPVTHLLYRGDHEQPKQEVPPGDLLVLSGVAPVDIPAKDPNLPSTGRRLAFARHLTDGRHPLVGRVLMNRIWALHFGRGLVASLADFGRLGERPSHPELLDWLASELPAQQWRLKAIHRLIVCSTAYRQSSARRLEQDKVDPDNRLLARFSVRRLEAEEVRDAMLVAAGQLELSQFGPPVPVANESADAAGRRTRVATTTGRRSVYLAWRRTALSPELETFDAPAMSPNCEVRMASTVAPQALMLLNSPFALKTAEAFADRVAKEGDPAQQVRSAWRIAFGIEPPKSEVEIAVTYLAKQTELLQARVKELAAAPPPEPMGRARPGAPKSAPTLPADPARAALATYCQALMASNRFLYVR
jgi:Protein of unknown function (DUF1553)/Protein of unknown function (DUF1549)/Planctomycete cytochrome C